jgi:hypothetical protein
MKKSAAVSAMAGVLWTAAMAQASLLTANDLLSLPAISVPSSTEETTVASAVSACPISLDLFQSGTLSMAEVVVGPTLRANYRSVIAQPVLSTYGMRAPVMDELEKRTATASADLRRVLAQV